MSSEESNEKAEKKITENPSDAEPTPSSDEEMEASAPQEEAPPAAEEAATEEVLAEEETSLESESAQAPEAEADSSPENEQGDGEVKTAETQPAINAVEISTRNDSVKEDEDPFSQARIQRILDIELPVNISFGSARRPLSEVLKLGPGALLELDRAADEPVVLKVNNREFARGEIVDIDGYYGVQITEISSPAQRIASLGD